MQRIGKKKCVVFLSAGIPAAIGTGIVEFLRFGDIGAAILVSLVGFVLIGLCLFFLAVGFNRLKRRAWSLILIHIFIMPLVGILLTGSYYFLAQYAPIGSWIEVETPPELIDHLLPSETSNIYGFSFSAQGHSGKTYRYECVTYEGCKWVQQQVEPQEIKEPGGSSGTVLETYFPPIPPGRIIESQRKISRGPDFETSIQLIRTADGRIFFWARYWSVYDVLFLLFGFSLVGLITGISTSITAFTALSPKRQ